MAGQALGMLGAGLGDAHAYPGRVLGVVRHPLPERVVGGVLAVDGGVHQNPPVVVAVPLRSAPAAPHSRGGWRVKGVGELHAAAAQGLALMPEAATSWATASVWPYMSAMVVTPEAIISARPRSVQADGPVVPAGLHREDVVVQPVLEVVAVAVAPHGGHGHVAVGVDKAGHEHVAPAVDLLLKGAPGALGADGADLRPLHHHIGVGRTVPASSMRTAVQLWIRIDMAGSF